MSAPPTVDVHAHALIPQLHRLLVEQPEFGRQQEQDLRWFGAESAAVNGEQMQRLGPRLTDPATRLAWMDRAGVDVQVISPMPLHHYWADRVLAERLTRLTNEQMAATAAVDPARLVGLGTVPLQHPDLAVAELTRAVDEYGLRGVQIGTFVDGGEIADDALDGFWARAAELDAVVFIHPWGCTLGERLDRHYLSNTVGNPVETTVALSHLVFSGLLDRHPGVRIVAAHGGGYLPTYLGRSDHAWQVRPDARRCVDPPSSYLRRMCFDSLVYTPAALQHLVQAVGADRVVLGSDYPFDMGVDDPVDRLRAAGLDRPAEQAIRGGTASHLFGLTELSATA